MRRLSRYSIRSLLVLVTLCALVFGWYRHCDAGHQREIAAITLLGQIYEIRMGGYSPQGDRVWGDIIWCGSCPHGHATVVNPGLAWVDRVLSKQQVDAFQRVRELTLIVVDYDPRCIEPLAELNSLRRLDLECNRMTPEQVRQLEQSLPETEVRLRTRDPQE